MCTKISFDIIIIVLVQGHQQAATTSHELYPCQIRTINIDTLKDFSFSDLFLKNSDFQNFLIFLDFFACSEKETSSIGINTQHLKKWAPPWTHQYWKSSLEVRLKEYNSGLILPLYLPRDYDAVEDLNE